ncbi:glycine cleavage T protein [Methylocaldum marinum]|uniref:Glycine cleavage T protein n=1 Tax=Methylocaldum marinum TaxID=1432792 RepID=A0A250KMJ9_9GAMM|nr:folate-binding protein YgfZ [Methylocaldum marinum]BBA32913.1 glycine cleavage T protein [Methylocaldum marinum]
MNDEWANLLRESRANPKLPLTATRNAFCGLADLGLLRVCGDDAGIFLQGQSTCDVAALKPGESRPGAFCNAKGRVIANFNMIRQGECYYLVLPADLAETIRKHLRIFVLRSKVSIENLTPRRGFIGLFGAGVTLPEGSVSDQSGNVLTMPVGQLAERTLIAAETATARRIWQYLQSSPDYVPVSPSAWRLKNIEEGLPGGTRATSEEFLPQMLNLDLLGGISYRKGCYTGQEVVARTHFLGHLKRRMFRLRTFGDREPGPGDPLYQGDVAEGQRIGLVVTAAPESEQAFQLLAVLPLDRTRSTSLRLFRPDGPAVEFLTMPYTFDVP